MLSAVKSVAINVDEVDRAIAQRSIIEELRAELRRAIGRGIDQLKSSIGLTAKAMTDSLPFRNRITNFGALGSDLDVACARLAVLENLDEVLEA